MKLKNALKGLLLYWTGVFVTFSVGAVFAIYLIVPALALVFGNHSFALPTSDVVYKTALLVVFCTFSVGSIMWISNEIQLRNKQRSDKGS